MLTGWAFICVCWGDEARFSKERYFISIEENKAIVRHSHEAWAGNEAVIDEIDDPNMRAYIRALYKAVPNLKFTIVDMIAEDDKVVVRWNVSGTDEGPVNAGSPLGLMPPTGQPFSIDGITIVRLEDGKEVESFYVTNWMDVLVKMGVNPMTTPESA